MNELGSSARELTSQTEVEPEMKSESEIDPELDIETDDVVFSDEPGYSDLHESTYEAEDVWSDEDLEADYEASDEIPSMTEAPEANDVNEFVPGDWEQIESDHGIESDAEAVNPNYDPEANGAWENNCQSCAPAYEMRRRGYDVEAKPLTDENEYLSVRPEDAWENPDIQVTEGNGKADIESKMQEWGDGSRAEVIVYWKEGGGHAFSAEQVDGTTKFVDSQTASDAGSAEYDAGNYFDHVRDDGSTYFWRTDDAKASPNIEDCCRKAER